MKASIFLLSSILLASTAQAQTAPTSGEDKSRTPASAPVAPQPDPDKPITITFAKLQRIVAAAQAQAQAQCVAQGAQADLADIVKQATPEGERRP